VIAQTQTAKRM